MFEETRVSVLEAIILVPAVHGRLPRLQRALTLLMLLSLTTSLGVKNFSLPHFIDEDTSPGYYRGQAQVAQLVIRELGLGVQGWCPLPCPTAAFQSTLMFFGQSPKPTGKLVLFHFRNFLCCWAPHPLEPYPSMSCMPADL